MIKSITLKFGHAPGSAPQEINLTPVTIFVGPNNSGKSRALREIQMRCSAGIGNASDVILEDMVFFGLSLPVARARIEQITQPPGLGELVPSGQIIVGDAKRGRAQVAEQELVDLVMEPGKNTHTFCSWFLAYYTLMLDGSSRIGLVSSRPGGDLQMPPSNTFQTLFRENAKRLEVRRIIYEAFGRFFVIDPTSLGTLRIRLSDNAPASEIEERGLHKEAVDFHAKAELMETASDGVKAFTGIITEVIAGDPSVVLMDEPEAFLHPSLSTKLGFEVSRAALNSEKRVMVSTHSSNFVMGCIQSGAPLNIVRLTYRAGIPTARVLPSEEVLELMRHPLLRSTGLLNGLFYEFVVVTESDADRAFYQEINERLLQFKPEWGIPNCLFINAQNKQTIPTLVAPLRKLGIPAAGVVDIDVLKEGGVPWSRQLVSSGVPELSRQAISIQREGLRKALVATGKDMKRDGGIGLLEGAELQAARDFLAQLQKYGLFVVAGGELECWLKNLAVAGHGPAWLVSMFEKMGEDQADEAYVRPGVDDVWAFISSIRDWLMNPGRSGIPA